MQSVQDGTTTAYVDKLVLVLAVFLLAQTVLTWLARRASFVIAEEIFAELREDFMRRVLGLPLSTVERAGTGDLISRTTADVDSLARTIRFAVPETLIAAVTTVLTVGAAFWVNPVAALPCLTGIPALLDRHALVPQARAGRAISGSARLTRRSPGEWGRRSRAAGRSTRSACGRSASTGSTPT